MTVKLRSSLDDAQQSRNFSSLHLAQDQTPRTPGKKIQPGFNVSCEELPVREVGDGELIRHRSIPSRPRDSDLEVDPVIDTPERRLFTNTSSTEDVASPDPYYSPVFQGALTAGYTIVQDASSVIKSMIDGSKKNEALDQLSRKAKQLSRPDTIYARTIAVVGDSGQGKSSVINCLLDFPEIAKTGDIGEACTSVVTEYHQKSERHDAPITIEVEYLSDPKIKDHLKELVWSYRKPFLIEMGNDEGAARDDAGDRNISDADFQRIEREADHAWSALEAAFAHQRSFSRDMLRDRSKNAARRIIDQLVLWSRNIEWPEGGSDGRWKATAETADECCKMTSIFMSDRLWPFTKIIQVFIDAPVLSTGIVLADLPGLQDTNLARIRQTRKYLLKSDHVFLVANIARAKSDASLRSSIYKAIARHIPLEWEESAGKRLDLAVICTKTDDINVVANRREFCGDNHPISSSEMATLDQEIGRATASGNDAIAKSRKRMQKALLISARNQHVTAGLQAAYSSKVSGGTLDVFCVSSKLYEKFSNSKDSAMFRVSGIPELRRHCLSITATARLFHAQNFLQSKVPSLLNSMELWAMERTKDKIIDCDVLNEAMEEMTETVTQEVNEAEDTLLDIFDEDLFQDFEKRIETWEDAAERQGEEWTHWHWSQYNAWVLNNGDHYTPKRGAVNWNSLLIWKLRSELESAWNAMEEYTDEECFSDLTEEIQTRLVGLKEAAKGQKLTSKFTKGIDLRMRNISYEIDRIQQRFLQDLSVIRLKASEPNGYMLDEMIPAYRKAAVIRGTGKNAKQIRFIQGRITNGAIFPNMRRKTVDDVTDLVGSTFAKLHKKLNAITEEIGFDLNVALDKAENSRVVMSGSEQDQKERFADSVMRLQRRHQDMQASIRHLDS